MENRSLFKKIGSNDDCFQAGFNDIEGDLIGIMYSLSGCILESSDELINWEESLANFSLNPEMGMALLFQNARVQLLPITRLESLKEFWNYAIKNDLEKLAYNVSRNLIESTEPSVELSDYSILLARANIFNKNFQQAEKWILFIENYVSQSNELDQVDLNSVKFLYNLQTIIYKV